MGFICIDDIDKAVLGFLNHIIIPENSFFVYKLKLLSINETFKCSPKKRNISELFSL